MRFASVLWLSILCGARTAQAQINLGNEETVTTATCVGNTTTLEVESHRATFPRHDQPLGKTVFYLRTKAGRELARQEEQEVWSCLGFNADRQAFILEGRWEAGVQVRIRSLLYWPETAVVPLSSRFDAEHDSAEQVLFNDADHALRYLVFIGQRGEGAFGLYVLNAATDRIQRLGEAPLPPPTDPDSASGSHTGPWSWEACDEELGGAELESEILHFTSGTTLQASYGRDSRKGRAKKRRMSTWDLQKTTAPER